MPIKNLDNYTFPGIIVKNDDSKGYGIYFPDLPGCVSYGKTLNEVMNYAREALELHLWGMEQDGEIVPKPSQIDETNLQEGQILCMIDINMFSVRCQMDNRSVKKTLTIPWYLNEIAERNKVNFSQVLQKALIDLLGCSK